MNTQDAQIKSVNSWYCVWDIVEWTVSLSFTLSYGLTRSTELTLNTLALETYQMLPMKAFMDPIIHLLIHSARTVMNLIKICIIPSGGSLDVFLVPGCNLTRTMPLGIFFFFGYPGSSMESGLISISERVTRKH